MRLRLLAAMPGPDQRERHELVGSLLETPKSVLDVGGLPSRLSAVLPPGTPCVAANTEPPADFLIPFGRMPFADRSVEAVASLDVLEHIPREDRKLFVQELLRVADRRVVLCCPYGSEAHIRAEKDLAEWLATRNGGQRDRFLDEHITNGLPGEEELRGLFETDRFNVEFMYNGDFRLAVRTYKEMYVLQETGHRWRARAKSALAKLNHELSSAPTPYTNRVFVRATVPSGS